MNELAQSKDGGLFQSGIWKAFQQSLGKQIFETEYFWGTITRAPFLGRYGEVSRGPVQEKLDAKKINILFQGLAQEKNLSFLRVEPQHQSLVENFSDLNILFRKAPFDVQPREILMLPLTDNEDDIFAHMKAKTRYNIRLAQKKGVAVRSVNNKEEVEQFLDLLMATAHRKKITFHSREYYRAFIDFFSENKGQTFIAIQNGKVLAGATLVFFEGTAYYLHGGSSDEGRNCMAPHLLQWEQIRYAKKVGCTQYDFGGITKNYALKGKNWTGITRFKEGFAPHVEAVAFPGTYDIIFSPFRYYGYQWVQRIKKVFI